MTAHARSASLFSRLFQRRSRLKSTWPSRWLLVCNMLIPIPFAITILAALQQTIQAGEISPRRLVHGRTRHAIAARQAEVVGISSESEAAISVHVGGAVSNDHRRPSTATGLPKSTMKRIKQNLADHSSDSWVSGTRMEAILELDYPQISVFAPGYLARLRSGATSSEVNAIAEYWLDKLPSDAQQYVLDGAAGDTASVGVGFINASLDPAGNEKERYLTYTKRELRWLLRTVPRVANGAISHRPPVEQAQLWDGECMPPGYRKGKSS